MQRMQFQVSLTVPWARLALVCVTIALTLHTLSMLNTSDKDFKKDSNQKAVRAMLITAFLLYSVSMLLSLFRPLKLSEHSFVSFIAAGCSFIGALFTIIGLGIHGDSLNDGIDLNPYVTTIYVIGLISSVIGGVAHVMSVVSESSPTAQPEMNVSASTDPAVQTGY